MTDAAIGYGSQFAIGDGGDPEVFTPVAEVFEITPADLTADTVDATHMLSDGGWREFVPGLLNPGESQIQINYVPGGSEEETLIAFLTSRATKNCKVTYPNNEEDVFAAFCIGFTRAIPLADKMTLTARFKLSGPPSFAV